MTSKVEIAQKVKELELWNLTPALCMSLNFLKMPISDKAFDLWLYKGTFGSHIRISC